MTDQNPVPTTRMPVPDEPIGDESSRGATDPTSSGAAPASDTEWAATPPPPPPPSPSDTFGTAPVPPVPPVVERPRRDERDAGRTASVVFGLVFLGLGLWFFADQTLGYELPRVRWSQLWPLVLVVIGLWVVLGSMRRGSR
jgi:hypothetical protein